MLIVTSLSEDATIRRITGKWNRADSFPMEILRSRLQRTVSLSVELVIFFRILRCHRRFSLFLKCKYLYKSMTLNIT